MIIFSARVAFLSSWVAHPDEQEIAQRQQGGCLNEQGAPDKTHIKWKRMWRKQRQVTCKYHGDTVQACV